MKNIKKAYWKNKFGLIRCSECGAWPPLDENNKEYYPTVCPDCKSEMEEFKYVV